MNGFIQQNKTNNSDIIDSSFGKYIINDDFINWYLNYEDDLQHLFMEFLNISYSNGISIDNNDENFNGFIIMIYNESHHI
jgi:hypothetical protein